MVRLCMVNISIGNGELRILKISLVIGELTTFYSLNLEYD